MTEPATAPETPETESRVSRKILLAVLAVLVVVLLAMFVVSRSGLDKALVKQQLDAFARSIAENARAQGRDVHFTYEDVAIHGSFSGRHATVINPQLSVKPLPGPTPVKPDDEMQIRTASFDIFPRAMDLSALKLVFDKPIDFVTPTAPEKKLMTVASHDAFTADVALTRQDNRPFITVDEKVPANIDVTYMRIQEARGEEEATPTLVPVFETLHVAQQPGGNMKMSLAQDGSGLGSSQVDMRGITLTPDAQPDGKISIGDITGDWSHVIDAQQRHVIHVTSHVGDVTGPQEILPYAPLSFTMAADYAGPAPQAPADAAAGHPAADATFKLSQFTLSSQQSKLDAKADFTATSADVLPVGTAQVTLSNVPFVLAQLHKYGFLNEENQPLIEDMAALITGSRLEDLKDADININRQHGGAFSIGKTTFEELFAVVLKDSMSKQFNRVPAPVPVPQLPKPGAPAPAKLPVVEEGTRG